MHGIQPPCKAAGGRQCDSASLAAPPGAGGGRRDTPRQWTSPDVRAYLAGLPATQDDPVNTMSTVEGYYKAKYPFAPDQEGDLGLSAGDVVAATDISGTWWHGYRLTQPDVHGQFPSNYVEATETPREPEPHAELPPVLARAIALHTFSAQTADDLEFREGDEINVTAHEGNWWQGFLRGTTKLGLFPRNYVLEYLPQPERMVAVHDFQSNTTFDLDGDGEPDISFSRGELVQVEAKGDGGGGDWWFGQVLNKPTQRGLFPSNYVGPAEAGTSGAAPSAGAAPSSSSSSAAAAATTTAAAAAAAAEHDISMAEPDPELPAGAPQRAAISLPIAGEELHCRLGKQRGSYGFVLSECTRGAMPTVVGFTPLQPSGALPAAAAAVPVGCILCGVNGTPTANTHAVKQALMAGEPTWADFSFFLPTHVKRAHASALDHLSAHPALLSGDEAAAGEQPAGEQQLWKVGAVQDLLASHAVPKETRKAQASQGGARQLLDSVELVARCLELQRSCAPAAAAMEGGSEPPQPQPQPQPQHSPLQAGLISCFRDSLALLRGAVDLQRHPEDHQRLYRQLEQTICLVRDMGVGCCRLVMGGWSLPPPREGAPSPHCALLFVVHRAQDDTFALSVCNTGPGSEYHISAPDEHSDVLLKKLSYTLLHIPRQKMLDSSMWFLLLRALAFPHKDNSPKELYEQLLPYLNQRPLLHNVESGHQFGAWLPEPLGQDTSRIEVAMEALRVVGLSAGLTPAYAQLLRVGVCWTLAQRMECALRTMPDRALQSSDVTMLGFLARGMAREAAAASSHSASAMTAPVCQRIAACVRALEEQAQRHTPSELPPALPPLHLTAGGLGSAHGFPLWGRLRRDESVEGLIGDAPRPAIEIPVCFTQMADSVATHHEAATAMRDAAELCTLLDYQRDTIKNAYLHRAALLEHLFTRVIPLPLPADAEPSKCFWRAAPMRYCEQADLLRLLDILCRHFVAVSLSLNVTRSFDATRMLVLGCITCIADCVLRLPASDRPSKFGLHYAGAVPGPVAPFGFDVGYYAVESENAKFTKPELQTARTQLLDYFTYQRQTIDDSHIIFAFESGMNLSEGDCQLLNQLALSTGYCREALPVERLLKILSGEEREILDYFPELGWFRDIVYCFKAFFVPSSDLLPEVRHWRPIDAALTWSCNDKETKVQAFGRTLKCAGFLSPQQDKRGFLRSLFSERKPRAPPSGADPSCLVGEAIATEDDVLYTKQLPDFGGRLRPRNCELLLQYLTAPYLRIPLVLEFFSDQMRISALASHELQEVVDSCLFEPGLWQASRQKAPLTTIPSKDGDGREHMATPLGLLFNELLHAPEHIIDAVDRMALCVLELDEGKWNDASSPYILFVLRLMVRLEGYILCCVEHAEWRSGVANSQAEVTSTQPGACSFVRGLTLTSEEAVAALRTAGQRLRSRLRGAIL
jgi:hypothetical protein